VSRVIARSRYVLSGRFSGMARWRAFYWYVLRDWETEICTECGRPVRLVWWCSDDQLWERVTGNAKTPGGREAASGIWCIHCFDAAARAHAGWIEWAPQEYADLFAEAEVIEHLLWDGGDVEEARHEIEADRA